jgi:hypothetical protein
MPERDADVLQVLIGKIGERRQVDFVLGKQPPVLGHAELFEPVSDLLIAAAPREYRASPARIGKFVKVT